MSMSAFYANALSVNTIIVRLVALSSVRGTSIMLILLYSYAVSVSTSSIMMMMVVVLTVVMVVLAYKSTSNG